MTILDKLKQLFFVKFRVWKFQQLSNCSNTTGKPNIFHPMLLKGKGQILFGKNVQIGVVDSPKFYSNYTFLEARDVESKISIGDNTSINNSFSAVAFSSITIKNNVLIGVNCSIIDTDGHNLNVAKRASSEVDSKAVLIENNVFIGDNVSILKGVTIGENSVIGFGSVVTSDIPSNVIAAGNPAKVIRNL
jgi:galactoside O-acetyltransferase